MLKRILLAAFVALQVADVALTNRVLAAGGWEANPIAAAAQAGFGGAWWMPKLALMLGCAVLMLRWRVRYIVPMVAVAAIVVVNNAMQ